MGGVLCCTVGLGSGQCGCWAVGLTVIADCHCGLFERSIRYRCGQSQCGSCLSDGQKAHTVSIDVTVPRCHSHHQLLHRSTSLTCTALLERAPAASTSPRPTQRPVSSSFPPLLTVQTPLHSLSRLLYCCCCTMPFLGHLRHFCWWLLVLSLCAQPHTLAQLNISLYSDSACLTTLSPTSLLFNSPPAWSSLSPSQVVAFNISSSALTSQRCQSTSALQAAGVGAGIYMCKLPNSTIVNGTPTLYGGAVYVLEWSLSNSSRCPVDATTSIDQSFFSAYFAVGRCTLGGSLTVDDVQTPVYSILNGCTVGGPGQSGSARSSTPSLIVTYLLGMTWALVMLYRG